MKFQEDLKAVISSLEVPKEESIDELPIGAGNIGDLPFRGENLFGTQMTDEEYFSSPAYSSSLLKRYDQNPKIPFSKGWSQSDLEIKQTKSKKIGSIIHKILLEEEDIQRFYPLLTPKEKEMITPIVQNFVANKINLRIMKDVFKREEVFFWLEKDIIKGKSLSCKCKIDLLTKAGYLIEIKTCSVLEEIPRQIDKYRYDLQLSFYRRALLVGGVNVKACGILAIETQPPYENHIYQLDDEYLTRGEFGSAHFKGWRDLICEMHGGGRPRFEKPVTLLTLKGGV